MAGSETPLAGHWQVRMFNKDVHYGPGCVESNLLDSLPSKESKTAIVTSSTLAKTTPAISRLESLLQDHHIVTIAYVRQHGPATDVERATEEILADPRIDTIISVGGGSAIDTAKVISLRAFERRGVALKHLCIPTTLSGAECTAGGGFTKSDGTKTGFRSPEMAICTIFYDAKYAQYTPKELWLSTGMRAMDHAVECVYHPCATEVPWKVLSLWAAGELYSGLARARDSHPRDEDVITKLMLAVYASSGLKGERLQGGMGLSHSLGYALGSPYGIPHGITSCLTLGPVVKLKARQSMANATEISRLLVPLGGQQSGEAEKDAFEVADRISGLVQSLGLAGTDSLKSWGVSNTEVPVITSRALGGAKEGALYDEVQELVQGLFASGGVTNGA